jgi:4-hydroxybenzoate polyprenyltransferase
MSGPAETAPNRPAPKPGPPWRLRSILKLTRFPLVFTAVADSAAAYFLVRGDRSVGWLTVGMLAATSACLYACGMIFNDAFDHLVDRIRHKDRPIPKGEVSAEQARQAGMALFVTAAVLACVVHFTAGIVAFLAFLGIMAYNGWTKEKGIAGALTMGSIRFLNFALGIVAAGLERQQLVGLPPGPWAQGGILAGYVVFLTALSQLEEKPSRAGVAVCTAGMMAAPVGAWAMGPTTPSMACAAALVLFVGGAGVMAAATPTKESIRRAVLWGVFGIILLDAAFAFGGKVRWEIAAGIAGLMVPALLARPLFKTL